MNRNLKYYVKIDDIDNAERELTDFLDVELSVFSDFYILPGFTDVHVHLREPGFLYKETIKTGSMSAAAGGFTDIFSMPNLRPCPDNPENLQVQLDCIKKDGLVNIYPYGAISVGEKGETLSHMKEIACDVIAFSDDGRGVANSELMEKAMNEAKFLDKIIVAHCEDEDYPKDSAETEWKQLERDLMLVEKTGCKYHACHLSTKESVELIRSAKKRGLDVTCETAPHYLTITRDEIEDSGRFKMNPPIKGEEDRDALIAGIKDGTIDMIATDHAPHSREEKNRGFAGSAFGIVGLETAFPVLYTKLVKTGIISMEKLIELLYINPRKRFGLEIISVDEILKSKNPTFTIWDMGSEYWIEPENFMSKGRSTPFEGWKVTGKCMATIVKGKLVYKR